MKIAILHHDLEWTEKYLGKLSREKGHSAKRFDIRETSLSDITKYNPDLILNRVYASVGNRDYKSLEKNLRLLTKLDERNFLVVNSLETAKANYSKHYAYKLMEKKGVKTPKTIVYEANSNLESKIEELGGFPLIVKRDSGGRGVDLARCENKKNLESAIKKIENYEDYCGKIILQEFIETKEKFDYRAWVIGEEFAFLHRRSLISLDGEKPWVGSLSLGSKIMKPNKRVPKKLKEFAEKAAKSISSDLDVLDIVKTKKGYIVIEHNPTPSLRSTYERFMGFKIIEKFLEKVLDKYLNE